MSIGVVVAVGVIGVVVGGAIGWLLLMMVRRQYQYELSAERRNRETQERTSVQNDQRQKEFMEALLKTAKAELLKASQDQLKENGQELSALNMKSLEPLMTSMKNYQEGVQRIEKDNIRRETEFKGQFTAMMTQTNKMADEANELANAIRGDSQVIGAWGEMQLKKVLDRAGLNEGIGYTYQETFAGENSTSKNLRTDVLVKLPRDRWVVVDSKNTVESYVQYKNAEDASDVQKLKEEILRSVKNHIDELKKANYGKNIKNAFAYSLAYIPFEEVYLMAVKGEVKISEVKRNLFDYAWENKVILVNASILMPALKLIELMWESDEADQKAKDIIKDANTMCEKFANFLKNYVKIGNELSALTKAYQDGMGQLATGDGNFLKKLRELTSTEFNSQKEKLLNDDTVEVAMKIPDAGESIRLAESNLNQFEQERSLA